MNKFFVETTSHLTNKMFRTLRINNPQSSLFLSGEKK